MDVLTLLDTFSLLSPDVDEEIGTNFLSTVRTSQALRGREDGAFKKFTAAANICLGKSKSKSLGLQAIIVLLEQCNEQMFIQYYKSWGNSALSAIKSLESSSVISNACQVMDGLLKKAPLNPDASKHFSQSCSAISTSITECLQKGPAQNQGNLMRTLVTLLNAYPGSCGGSANAIQNHILAKISPKGRDVAFLTAEIFSLLPRLGGGGRDGIHHKDKWSQQFINFLECLNNTALDLETLVTSRRQDKLETTLRIPSCSSTNIVQQVFFWSKQGEVLTTVLSELLLSAYPCNKVFSLNRFMDVAEAFFKPHFLTCVSRDGASRLERQVLATVLPSMWKSVLRMCKDCIRVCKDDCLPIVGRMLHIVSSLYESVGPSYANREAMNTFKYVKIELHETVELLCNQFGANCGLHFAPEKFSSFLLRDVIPFKTVMSLMIPTGSGKRKKSRGANSKDQMSSTNSFVSPGACSELCIAALRALKSLISASGILFPAPLLKDIQVCIVGLSLETQQNQASFETTAFQNPFCRKGLFEVLLQLCLLPHPRWAAPVHFGVHVFRSGRQDDNCAVAAFCNEASIACESIVHPRSASLNIDSLLTTEEIAEVKEKLTTVHTLILRGAKGESQQMNGHDHDEGVFKKKQKMDNDSNGVQEVEDVDDEEEVHNGEAMKQGESEAVADKIKNVIKAEKRTALRPIKKNDDQLAKDIPESNMTKEETESFMKHVNNFDHEPVIIPDGVKNRPAEIIKQKNGAEKIEEEKKPVDVDDIMSKFVAESSDEED